LKFQDEGESIMTPFFTLPLRRRPARRRLDDLPPQLLRDIGLTDWGRPR
jgi:hypothetical protein